MTPEEIARIATEALAPNVPINLDQLCALVMLLAISVVLLVMGMGYQIARLERRVKQLEGTGPAPQPARSR